MEEYYAKIDAFLSQEKRDSLTGQLDVEARRSSMEKPPSIERLLEVEMHPVNGSIFTREYDHKNGHDHHFTQRAPSEEGYVMDEGSSSEAASSSTSPVPSDSTNASDSNFPSGPGLSVVASTKRSVGRHSQESPQDLSSMMNDGHFDTSGYTSNNSSKDDHPAQHHHHDADNSSDVASLRSVSPESMSAGAAGAGVAPRVLTSQFVRKPSHVQISSPTRLSNETPIERDIRLAAMRDNEFRLQQGLTSVHTSEDVERTVSPKKLIKSVPVSDEHYTNTQRLLATTRLQQEIEEQKRRELDLKRDGRVQSISEERMDNDFSHYDELDDNNVFTPRHGTSPSPAAIDPALQKATIKEQRAFFESSIKPAPLAPIIEKSPVKPWTGHVAPPKTPVPMRMSLSGSTSNSMIIPVSMEKFFATRGKSATTSRIISPTPPLGSSNVFYNTVPEAYVDFTAVRKISGEDADLGTSKKTYRTAKTKISEELREMEEREAQLREERKNLGLISKDSNDSTQTPCSGAETEHYGATDAVSDVLLEVAQIPKGRQSVLLAQFEALSHQ